MFPVAIEAFAGRNATFPVGNMTYSIVEQPQLFIALGVLRSIIRVRKRLSHRLFLKRGNIVHTL